MKAQQPHTCGFGSALDVIGGKWKSAILWALQGQPTRFGALKRQLPGISEKVLFEQLREMEAAGIIRRQVFDQVPLRVEYSVTEAGASLNEAVHMLAEWGLKHVVAPRQLMADAAQ